MRFADRLCNECPRLLRSRTFAALALRQACTPLIIRSGAAASSNMLRRVADRSKCARKGPPSLRAPGFEPARGKTVPQFAGTASCGGARVVDTVVAACIGVPPVQGWHVPRASRQPPGRSLRQGRNGGQPFPRVVGNRPRVQTCQALGTGSPTAIVCEAALAVRAPPVSSASLAQGVVGGAPPYRPPLLPEACLRKRSLCRL